jgi:hypothetical protein
VGRRVGEAQALGGGGEMRKFLSIAAVVADVLLLIFLAFGIFFELTAKGGDDRNGIVVLAIFLPFTLLNLLAIGFGARLPARRKARDVAETFS